MFTGADSCDSTSDEQSGAVNSLALISRCIQSGNRRSCRVPKQHIMITKMTFENKCQMKTRHRFFFFPLSLCPKPENKARAPLLRKSGAFLSPGLEFLSSPARFDALVRTADTTTPPEPCSLLGICQLHWRVKKRSIPRSQM